jgi:hypothetical protein
MRAAARDIERAADNGPKPAMSTELPRIARRPRNKFDPNCFLSCSFNSTEFAPATRDAIEAVCNELGFPSHRIDELPTSAEVMGKVREAITWANFVIADLSGKIDNCMYELGIADTLLRPTVIIQKHGTSCPFDIYMRNVLEYRDAADLRAQLGDWIHHTVMHSDGPPNPYDQCKGEYGRSALEDDYLLSGYIVPNVDTQDAGYHDERCSYDLHLSVRDLEKRDQAKTVTFHLDGEFDPDHVTRRFDRSGVARLKRTGYGASTVGAVVGPRKVRLELDLTKVPGATPSFRYEP